MDSDVQLDEPKIELLDRSESYGSLLPRGMAELNDLLGESGTLDDDLEDYLPA